MMAGDRDMPRKQRHTIHRIFERLRDEDGYKGSYESVWRVIQGLGEVGQEVFMPLIHRPGEAQVDFGQALVKVNGKLQKAFFFVMALP